jgi:GNAT superfamily N-acetyltransferase
MKIAKLGIDEIPELVKLYDELVPVKNELEAAQKKYREIIDNDDYMIFVAKEEDKIIGTAMGICCKTLAFNGKNFLVVEDVIVSEKYRGKGIGRKLFEALDNFAIDKNCAYAILVSSDFRAEAHIFYEKMGYIDGVKGFRKGY